MLPNLIVSQMGPGGGIVDLLRWDPDLFTGMTVPDGIDLDGCINAIVKKHGEAPLAHPDPDYMAHYIPLWSAKNQTVWTKMLATITVEYNPIENYDRMEDWTDTTAETRNQTGTVDETGSDTLSGSTESTGNTEHLVSAENASDYQPDSKDTDSQTATNSQNSEREAKTETSMDDTRNENVTRTGRAHGNIGVTTTQQMLEEERRIVQFTMEDFIADSFKEEFCLMVW